MTDRSLQDMTLKHRSLLVVQVKRRRNTTVGVSSVIVGHEAVATLVLLQALLASNSAYGSALSPLVSVSCEREARIEYHRTVKIIASLRRFAKSILGAIGEKEKKKKRTAAEDYRCTKSINFESALFSLDFEIHPSFSGRFDVYDERTWTPGCSFMSDHTCDANMSGR